MPTISGSEWIVVGLIVLLWLNYWRLCRFVPRMGKTDENESGLSFATLLGCSVLAPVMLLPGNSTAVTIVAGLLVLAASWAPQKTHKGNDYKGWFKYPFLPGVYFDGDFEYKVRACTLKIFISGRKFMPVTVSRRSERGHAVTVTVQLDLTALLDLPLSWFGRHKSVARRSVRTAAEAALDELNWPINKPADANTASDFRRVFLQKLRLNDQLRLEVVIGDCEVINYPRSEVSSGGNTKVWPKPKVA